MKSLVYVADKEGNKLSIFSVSPRTVVSSQNNGHDSNPKQESSNSNEILGNTLAVEETYAECIDNGNIAPCIGENGRTVFYCDDPRSEQAGPQASCLPSPQEWAQFLPDCLDVNFEQACSGPEGPVFTCDDPEFDIRKYPYGCIEPGQGQEGKEAQSQDSKTNSYQLIVYLDDASPQNVIGDNFKILVYNSENETILSAKPNIDFNDDHQKISPKDGYPIIQQAGQNPDDIRVCAQQDYVLNSKSYLHDDCYPIKQNIQKTYWYTIFDYGQIDGFEGGD
jgi:hypothetical protein